MIKNNNIFAYLLMVSFYVQLFSMDEKLAIYPVGLEKKTYKKVICSDPLCNERQKLKESRGKRRISEEQKRIECAMEYPAEKPVGANRVIQGLSDFGNDQTEMIRGDVVLVAEQFKKDNLDLIEAVKFGTECITDPRAKAMNALGLYEVPHNTCAEFKQKVDAAIANNKQFRPLYSNTLYNDDLASRIAQGDRSISDALKEGDYHILPDTRDIYLSDARINTIHDLPYAFANGVLKNLQKLDLSGNNLSDASIPLVINVSPFLKEYNVSSNIIPKLMPADFAALASARNLQKIDLSHNRIDTVEGVSQLKWRNGQHIIFHLKLDNNALSDNDCKQIRTALKLTSDEQMWVECRPYLYHASKRAAAGIIGYIAFKIFAEKATHSFVAPIVEKNFGRMYKEGIGLALNHGINAITLPMPLRTGYAVRSIVSMVCDTALKSAETLPLQKEMEYTIVKKITDAAVNTTNFSGLYNRWTDPAAQMMRNVGFQTVQALQHPNTESTLRLLGQKIPPFVSYLPKSEQELKLLESGICGVSTGVIAAGVLGIGAMIDGVADLAIPHIKNPYCPVIVTMEGQQPVLQKEVSEISSFAEKNKADEL